MSIYGSLAPRHFLALHPNAKILDMNVKNARVAVLASGEGTTAEAVAKVWAAKTDAPRIELIITNNPTAGILRRLSDVESAVIEASDEQAILDKLEAGNFDLIWLAGYMKKIGPKLVRRFGCRGEYKSPYQAMMLNTHPGLLPATKGLIGIHVQEFLLEHIGQKAGHTLHVVSEEYDEGPTIAEHKVPIEPGDTAETLFEHVKASERKHLPDDLADFIEKRKRYLGKKQ